MKLTELIAHLEHFKKLVGDVEVTVDSFTGQQVKITAVVLITTSQVGKKDTHKLVLG